MPLKGPKIDVKQQVDSKELFNRIVELLASPYIYKGTSDCSQTRPRKLYISAYLNLQEEVKK